jgi:predicted subunit of tRNA(5-methylaminomethyl-2-thiouridylate) methyltransferase
MERLEFDLLFRWFVGIGIDDAVWEHSTFSKNRDRRRRLSDRGQLRHRSPLQDLARQRASKLVNFVFTLRRTPSEHETQERRRCDRHLSFARLLSA